MGNGFNASVRQQRRRRRERDVRQCLRKISEEPLAGHPVLLGQQADIVPQADCAREHSLGILEAAEQMETLGEPERAEEEGAFPGWEPVVELLAAIASNEAVIDQICLDRLDRRLHARVVRWEKTDQRQPQQAGIDVVSPVEADEAAAFLVEALREDVLADLVTELLPALERSLFPVLAHRFYSTVHGNPRHDLGVDEVPSLGSEFPEAVVGLAPV